MYGNKLNISILNDYNIKNFKYITCKGSKIIKYYLFVTNKYMLFVLLKFSYLHIFKSYVDPTQKLNSARLGT